MAALYSIHLKEVGYSELVKSRAPSMRNSVKNPRFPGYPGAKVRHQKSLGTNLVVGEDPGNKVD